VIARKLLQHDLEFGIAIPWHGGEEMMLELVLHATPQPFGEGVCADGIARGFELRRDPVGLVLCKHLLGLMRGRDDDGGHEAAHEDGGDPDGGGEEGEEDGVVHHETVELGLGASAIFGDGIDCDRDGIESPQGEEE